VSFSRLDSITQDYFLPPNSQACTVSTAVPKIWSIRRHLQVPGWGNLHQEEVERPWQLITAFQGHSSDFALPHQEHPMKSDRLQKQLQAESGFTPAPVRN